MKAKEWIGVHTNYACDGSQDSFDDDGVDYGAGSGHGEGDSSGYGDSDGFGFGYGCGAGSGIGTCNGPD